MDGISPAYAKSRPQGLQKNCWAKKRYVSATFSEAFELVTKVVNHANVAAPIAAGASKELVSMLDALEKTGSEEKNAQAELVALIERQL